MKKIKPEDQDFVPLCLSGISSIPALLRQPPNTKKGFNKFAETLSYIMEVTGVEPVTFPHACGTR
ncbi:MAG TPA: hypothetical protein PL085_17835, partial [Agriterribacter sp.]|uniref:hypothetical protein n=1 Tax=Agriterribacter sp. TaxID=2821509 RepID=UPI002D07BDD2